VFTFALKSGGKLNASKKMKGVEVIVKRKNFLFMLLLVSITVLFVACGGGNANNDADNNDGNTEENNNNENTEEANNDGGEEITKLVVGSDATYAPMEYIDDSGEIVGIDIDIIDAIAEELGIELEVKNIGWEPLFPALKNGEIDFAVSSITITEERQKEFDFTEPYYEAKQVILVPEDSDISGLADLEDKRVTVQINTTGHIAMQEFVGETNPNIVASETMPIAIQEMLNGNAEASVGDNSTVNEYLKNNPDAKVKVIEDDDSFEKEFYGLMVQKGNVEVLELLDEGIKAVKENGKLKEITGLDLD